MSTSPNKDSSADAMTASLQVQRQEKLKSPFMHVHIYMCTFPIINLGNMASGRQPLWKSLSNNLPGMTPYGVIFGVEGVTRCEPLRRALRKHERR